MRGFRFVPRILRSFGGSTPPQDDNLIKFPGRPRADLAREPLSLASAHSRGAVRKIDIVPILTELQL